MSQFARVLLDQKTGRALDYRVPEALREVVAVGSRVRVPLRTRLVPATVFQLLEESPYDGVKDIAGVADASPMIRPVLLELALWMADYYCCPVEIALRGVLPQVVRDGEVGPKIRKVAVLSRAFAEDELEAIARRAPRQVDALRAIQAAGGSMTVVAAAGAAGVAEGVFRTMEEKGLITIVDKAFDRDPHAGEIFLPSQDIPLNDEQMVVFNEVKEAVLLPVDAKPMLLFGVTGSGKTEIYLRAIRQALEAGRTALVLVPEIALTPQTVERFKSRFSDIQGRIAVLHSHLSAGERRDEWHKIHTGRSSIVIGARSAIFSPLENLGIIIVDEEHEPSYKQEEAPRYNARDLAVLRARLEGCPVLLGSATPSLESWANVQSGKYKLLQLTKRVDGKQMPIIRVLDMRRESRIGPGILSNPLRAAVEGRLAKGEQAILFLNRRGFSTTMLCEACGYVCECPDCSVSLTYHRDEARLLCHICGHNARAPKACPQCRDEGIRHTGIGTQKVEDAVLAAFPKARIARMDADSMQRKEAYRETLGKFRAKEIDILVGTQMIAKGLHFPNVTLVGIINADMGLHMPDFRAGERTFQLLVQVAGRAGRGEMEGEVFVQTFTPSSPSIQFARHHDYEGFMDQETEFRSKFGFPPFSRMVLITLRGARREMVEFTAQTLSRKLGEAAPAGVVVGEAVPAPLEKARGQHRFHVSLRGPSSQRLSVVVRTVLDALPMPEEVFVAVDVDPLHLL